MRAGGYRNEHTVLTFFVHTCTLCSVLNLFPRWTIIFDGRAQVRGDSQADFYKEIIKSFFNLDLYFFELSSNCGLVVERLYGDSIESMGISGKTNADIMHASQHCGEHTPTLGH